MNSQALSSNLLVDADKKNFSRASTILGIYGLAQIILIVFFMNLGIFSILTFITGALYTISGILGMGAAKNYSLSLLKWAHAGHILLMILNVLIFIASVIVIIIDLIDKPDCKVNDESCHNNHTIFAAILLIFIISAIVSLFSFLFTHFTYKMGRLFKHDITQALPPRIIFS